VLLFLPSFTFFTYTTLFRSPQLSIPLPMRVSQIAFSADETYLIVSAESGGGLAVYEVQSLLQGNTQTAFELATNGETLRTLLPRSEEHTSELQSRFDLVCRL